MSDASSNSSKPPLALQGIAEIAAGSAKSGPFIVQSSQIAMNSVEKMINLQAGVLKASFDDMQSLVAEQGKPSPEVAAEAFKVMIDRSMEHVRITLAATQEMHKAYLDLMEGHLHIMRLAETAKPEN